MKKTEMSLPQLEKYESLKDLFLKSNWIFPNSSTAFDNGFLVNYEITVQKRYENVFLQIQINFSSSYISLSVVQHPIRNSEYFINFNESYSSLDYLFNLLKKIDSKTTHDDVVFIVADVISKFPNSVTFFADDEEIPLNLKNLQQVVLSDPANR
jgi:hypothetical protein